MITYQYDKSFLNCQKLPLGQIYMRSDWVLALAQVLTKIMAEVGLMTYTGNSEHWVIKML